MGWVRNRWDGTGRGRNGVGWGEVWDVTRCGVLCCAVLLCDAVGCGVMCCAVLCCVVMCCDVL